VLLELGNVFAVEFLLGLDTFVLLEFGNVLLGFEDVVLLK
jgi:hypothetical protein